MSLVSTISDRLPAPIATVGGAARLVTDVSVVVPCFNEQAAAPHLIAALERLRDEHAEYCFEFVLVDDGSSDDTWNTFLAHTRDLPDYVLTRHAQNRGIAAAIRTGIEAARHEIVCSIDSDCTYDPGQLIDLLPLLTDGVDVVTASPYHPRGRVHNVPAWRLAVSRVASALYRALLRHKLYTYTSCFRVYRRSRIRDVCPANDGFVGVAELLWIVDRRGGRIVECPATLDVRRYGQSKLRVLSVVASHLRLLGRIAYGRVAPGRPLPLSSPHPRGAL